MPNLYNNNVNIMDSTIVHWGQMITIIMHLKQNWKILNYRKNKTNKHTNFPAIRKLVKLKGKYNPLKKLPG